MTHAQTVVTYFTTPGRRGNSFFSIRSMKSCVFRLCRAAMNSFLSSSLAGAFSGQPTLLKQAVILYRAFQQTVSKRFGTSTSSITVLVIFFFQKEQKIPFLSATNLEQFTVQIHIPRDTQSPLWIYQIQNSEMNS